MPANVGTFALHTIGLTYRELAELTGDSLRTIDRQLVRARGKLRPHVDDKAHT